MPYPYGIADVPADTMIDIDEAGVSLETANRGYGKAHIATRVRQVGLYGHSDKFTILLAISGRPGPLDRFMLLEKRPGTDVHTFAAFVANIINQIGQGTPNNQRCFTFDNLSAHKHPLVLQLIVGSGHRYALRAPYYLVDGPIGYIFNVVQNYLRIRMYKIHNDEDLVRMIHEGVNSIPSFLPFFRNVRFN